MRNVAKLLVGIIVAGQVIAPGVAAAVGETSDNSVKQKVPPLLVREYESTLVAKGCRRVALNNRQEIEAATAAGWLPAVPADATGEALVFCPPGVVTEIGLLGEGEVAGFFVNIAASTLWAIGEGANQVYNLASGSKGTLLGKGAGVLGSVASGVVASVLEAVFVLLAKVGNYLGSALAGFIPRLLTQDVYISADVVRNYWPIVLGVVNMGFLLALVVIALFTTLRLDIGGGVRRMLPRLLIAALLVNFSLVIAGVILDISRVVMALMTVAAGLTNLDELSKKIDLNSARKTAFVVWFEEAFLKVEGGSKWAGVVAMLFHALAMWAMAISLLIVVVTLLIRYFAIMALLIFSPVAYVLFAFPNMAGLAARWWKMFLKYVIVGPVILFFMLIAVESLGVDNQMRRFFGLELGNAWNNAIMAILNTIMFATFFVLAALAGKFAGVAGSSAMITIATKTGRRVRGMAYRGAVRTGKAGGKAVYVGTGARAGVRAVGRQGRDFGRAVKTGITGRLPKPLQSVKRDKEGRPLKGQPRTLGERLGAGVAGGRYNSKQRQQAKEAQDFTPTGATQDDRKASVAGAAAWRPTRLGEAHVAESLTQQNRQNIMDMGSRAQKVALAGNTESVRKMDEGEKNFILKLGVNLATNLPTNTSSSYTNVANGKKNEANELENSINKDIQRAFQRSVDKLDKEKGQA